MLIIDQNSFKNIGIYYIGYITKKDKYKIDSVNPLYLLLHRIDGLIEEKEGSKYLSIASTDRNSKFLEKHAKVWSGVKDQIEKINGSESGEYEKKKKKKKKYMKIKFNSDDDDLPLNKQVKFLSITIIVGIFF